MLLGSTASGLTFGLSEITQFLMLAFFAGGIVMQVKTLKDRQTQLEENHKERVKAIEERHNRLEERFLTAVEDLGKHISRLTTRLETVVAVHESRINALEGQDE